MNKSIIHINEISFIQSKCNKLVTFIDAILQMPVKILIFEKASKTETLKTAALGISPDVKYLT